METGKLYVCPTPIGNLDDITLRTINILNEADLIAAEDTRHSLKLLNALDIKKPMTSYHEHNIAEKGPELIEKLQMGTTIALVSDAGMPGISDPGEDLIKRCIENGIEVVGLPGPTASILALVISGFDTRRFTFYGFTSSKKKERREELMTIKSFPYTTIIYESPHRLLSLLEDMVDVLEDRKISVSRELTKKYEETFRGSVGQALEKFQAEEPRGEFVIVIEGNKDDSPSEDIDIMEELRTRLENGYTKKQAIKEIVTLYDLPKNLVYQKSLEI